MEPQLNRRPLKVNNRKVLNKDLFLHRQLLSLKHVLQYLLGQVEDAVFKESLLTLQVMLVQNKLLIS
jgi:hypothetical protein